MKNLVIELKEKFAERQITAYATNRGWQATVENPKRGKPGSPVVISNPVTAEAFVQDVFKKELDSALITHEARQAAVDAEAVKRAELEKELGL